MLSINLFSHDYGICLHEKHCSVYKFKTSWAYLKQPLLPQLPFGVTQGSTWGKRTRGHAEATCPSLLIPLQPSVTLPQGCTARSVTSATWILAHNGTLLPTTQVAADRFLCPIDNIDLRDIWRPLATANQRLRRGTVEHLFKTFVEN